jgi:cytosine/adenosine deaminase-related metal-dependent hydrolase
LTEWLAIENAVLLPMDAGRRILDPGHVVVHGDRIVAVGQGAAPRRPDLAVIDAEGGIVLPGLIDAHAHAGHALTKGIGASSAEWMRLAGHIYARAVDPQFWRAEAALSALERLRCGTTTAVLLLGGGPDVMRTESPEAAEAHIDGVRAVGVAEVLAIGPNRPSGPRSYLDWQGVVSVERPVAPLAQLAQCADFARARRDAAGGLIRLALSLPVFTAGELANEGEGGAADLSRRAQALAREHELMLMQDGHRSGSIAAAEQRLGQFGPNALFAHCIDLTEADIAALRRSGAKVAHNPSSMMSVFGRCPAPELAAQGITVAFGSDAPAPDRPFDLFRIMFHAHRLHARHFADDSVLPPWEVLEMATIRGAKALGLEREIGSLAPGKRADLILVDWRKPHLWPPANPVQRLTRFANGGDVDTVVVGGRVLMRAGRVLHVDERKILSDASLAFSTMVERAQISGSGASGAQAMGT